MRFERFGLFFLLLVVVPVWSKQPQSPPQTQPGTVPSPAPQDPQAVSVVNQALTVAGGTTAIIAISDYTGIGTITYHLAEDVQGTVTVRGSGLDQFRVDANLPNGVRSEAISGSRMQIKAEDGNVGSVISEAPTGPSRVILPYLLLACASSPYAFSLSYLGLVEQDGHPAHEIELQRVLPGLTDSNGHFRESHTIDFFIDPSTFQILMTQESLPGHDLRRIRYSDYRTVSTMAVPFSISEESGGLPRWQIQLDQIGFNTGIEDSVFQF
jgi:hypothetical protein